MLNYTYRKSSEYLQYYVAGLGMKGTHCMHRSVGRDTIPMGFNIDFVFTRVHRSLKGVMGPLLVKDGMPVSMLRCPVALAAAQSLLTQRRHKRLDRIYREHHHFQLF